MTGVFAYFFYRSPWGLLPALPAGALYARRRRTELKEEAKKRTGEEFAELLRIAAANLNAGYSVENAFCQAGGELKTLFGKSSRMAEEMTRLRRGLENNRSFEKLFKELAGRYDVEDIQEFAEVFSIAVRSGGKMNEIIASTVETLSVKAETEREIGVMLASRRLEQKVMNAIPFFILFYVDRTSEGYFDILYGNAVGVAVMSGCFAAYLFSVLLSDKTAAIHV